MKTLPASKILFIAGRYGLYGFMGAEIILLPHIIPEKNAYGDVEYFKSFIVLVPLLLMGFHSGYLRTCYVHQQDLRGGLMIGGTILLVPLAIASAFYFNNVILFFACLASGIGLFIEKIYQRDERFILSLLYKPLIAVFNILLLYLSVRMWSDTQVIPYLSVIGISYIAALGFFIVPAFSRLKLKIDVRQLKKEVKILVSNGFWLNLGTVSLQLLIFTDRTYLRRIDSGALADYSFAFNISQALFIFFTSVSYLNEVKLGAKYREFRIDQFWSILKRQVGFLVVGVLFILVGYEFLLKIYPQFAGGRMFLMIVAPAWGFFFAAGALGVLAQYIDVQKQLSLVLLGLMVGNALMFSGSGAFMEPLSPLIWILKSGLLVLGYGLFMLWIIYRKLVRGEWGQVNDNS